MPRTITRRHDPIAPCITACGYPKQEEQREDYLDEDEMLKGRNDEERRGKKATKGYQSPAFTKPKEIEDKRRGEGI
jgi:hypothetical protein